MVIKIVPAWVFLLLLVSGHIVAMDLDLALTGGAEHTDNALISSENLESDLEKTMGVDLALDHTGGRMVLELDYNVDYSSYDKDSQDDVSELNGNALLVYEQLENKLYWTIENSRRNILSDKQLVDVSSNREDRSISGVSSDLVLRPSAVNTVSTRIFFTDIAYEESQQQDSERVGASINWRHSLSAVDFMSADLSHQDVSFEKESDGYEYSLATFGYGASLAKLKYSLNAGYNKTARGNGGAEGNYFNAIADYNGEASVWAARLIRELTDTSRQNNNTDISNIDGSGNLGEGIDFIERSSVILNYENTGVCEVCKFQISLRYVDEDYEVLDSDGIESAISVDFSYRYSRFFTLRTEATYRDYDFAKENSLDSYNIVQYGLGLEKEISPSLLLMSRVLYSERDSDSGETPYEELRGGVSFEYRFY